MTNNVSRRGFLRAMGLTTLTVCLGDIPKIEHPGIVLGYVKGVPFIKTR